MENETSLENIEINLKEIYTRNNMQRLLDWGISKKQKKDMNKILENTRKLVSIKKKLIAINKISLRLDEEVRHERILKHRKQKIKRKIINLYHLSIKYFLNIFESLKKLHKFTEHHNKIMIKSKEFNKYQVEILERLLKQEHEEFEIEELELEEEGKSLKERESKTGSLVKLAEMKEKLLKENYSDELLKLEEQEEESIKEVSELIENASSKLSILARLEKKAMESMDEDSFETIIHKANDAKLTSEELIDKIRGIVLALYNSQKIKIERRSIKDKIYYNSYKLLKLVKKEPNKLKEIKKLINHSTERIIYGFRQRIEEYNYKKIKKKINTTL